MSDDDHCPGAKGDGHHHGITCREISEFLLSYLERELDTDAQQEFERHLQLCPPCEHYLDGYRDTVKLVRSCGRAELDPEQKRKLAPPEDLVQAILTARAKSESPD